MINIRIGMRLALGFGAVLTLLAAITVTAMLQMNSAAAQTQRMMDVPLSKERMVSDWYATINAAVRRTGAIARSADPSLVEFFAQDVKASGVLSTKLQNQIETLLSNDQEREVFTRLAAARQTFIKVRDEITNMKKEGQSEGAMDKLNTAFRPAADAYLGGMQELQRLQREEIDRLSVRLNSEIETSARWLAALGVLAVLLGSGAAWMIARSITVPLAQAVSVTREVADGDLSHHVQTTRKDELGDLLNALASMKTSLIQTVGQVRSATDSINTASYEIASGNQDLSARTEQAASNLEETAASMEELTSTVRQSADAARQANQLAASAAEIAVRGGQVVGQVVTTMDEINHSSKKISDIIGVIDGIAFQTNILALNAAVEAARAGEQGRGFAVVAGEVRNLAQRSAEAAKEIKNLIGASVDRVEAGSRLVADAGQTMSEIVGSVQRVSDIIGEITAAAGEQSDGIGQVNVAVTQLDQMTQQNAALVEQSAAAAESLKDQASRLTEVIKIFRIDGSGASAPVAVAKPTTTFKPVADKPASPKPVSIEPTLAAPAAIKAQTPRAAAPAAARPAPAARPAVAAGTEGDWESF